MPGSPVDLSEHIRCVDGALQLTYPTAIYVVALLDVLEKLAADRYGAPPREPFGAVRDALNAAACQLAPAGTCAAASEGEEAVSMVEGAPMSTREAAELLEISTAGTTYLIRHGRLQATKFGRQWAITGASVAAYRASRRRKDVA
ncbi:helix-turn-helix domain-containing protein [Mycobacterium sp.]|uniref:helix-turn-helix domain-containing protein n=1 Tax=Mycobacterium sp. TaxID=1785 RepID=UPI002BF4D2DB|nr:helix-turn-helix domain-containing protein [Mycobacterium sp.]HTY35133.1 helix-turn-helix domain-containing protein [Mycobacterium sp.]